MASQTLREENFWCHAPIHSTLQCMRILEHAPLWLHWIRYETQVSHGVPFEAGNFGAD